MLILLLYFSLLSQESSARMPVGGAFPYGFPYQYLTYTQVC